MKAFTIRPAQPEEAGLVLMSIIVAYGLFKAYDEPVREWLKDHWLHRKKAA